jgi:6-phosphogluconolactonase
VSGAGPTVSVFPDNNSLSGAAADLIVKLVGRSIASRNRFCVALSGGSTPRTLYTLLASVPRKDFLSWERIHVFWADERCVPPEHPDSNYRLAFETLLSRVSLPDGNIHRVRGEQGSDPAARAYEDELRRFFGNDRPRFDLVLLGAGEDGHTASLFPGSPALREKELLAVSVHFDPPMHSRVTLTLPVLNDADYVLFLAAGRTKARIVQELIEGLNPDTYPAGLVRPVRGSLHWMLDRDAASLLRDPSGGRKAGGE